MNVEIQHAIIYTCGMIARGLDGADEVVFNLGYFVIVADWFLCAGGEKECNEY